MQILCFIISIFITIFIILFFNNRLKVETKNKSYLIIKDKFEKYKKDNIVEFEYINSIYTSFYEKIEINNKTFTINKKKYNITDELKIKYSISGGSKYNFIILINDKDYFNFNYTIIKFETLLSFLVIIYLIKENIDTINFKIIDDIILKLEDKSLNINYFFDK